MNTKLLPPDPEEMNDDRAEWAQVALDAFAHVTGMDTAGEDDETVLGDLLCDIMHWCDRNGVSFAVTMETARVHYDAETQP